MNKYKIEAARIRVMDAYTDRDDKIEIAKEEEIKLFRDYIEEPLQKLSSAMVKFKDREILSKEELRQLLLEDLEAMI